MNHIPRSVIRNQLKAMRREQARQVRAAAPGEKMMAAMNPNRGYSWTTWTQDRAKQIWHMKNWVGVCIDKLANLTAQLVPNIAYVRSSKGPGAQKRFKDGSRFDGNLKYLDCGGHSFISGGYRRKALGVVKPHEEIEPVEHDHPLRRLIESPNDWDTQFDHDYELAMFHLLCGVAYDWAVPNPDYPQYPKELWCIPSHWVWPMTGTGEAVDPQHPFADRIVAYYEIRPWGGTGSAGTIRIPPDQIIRYTFKSPISKIDGWAKTQLMANWIDADDSIAKSQFAQMSNSAMPSFWLELGEGYEDPTDDQIDRIGSKFMGRYTGEYNMGRPFIGPPGTVPHPLSFPPLHMAYGESGDQSRDRIVSGFGLNLPILGLSENQTFGSVLANLMSVSVHTLKPLLTSKGQRQTKDLCSKFPGNIRAYYDDPTPIDPDQLNKDIDTDAKNGAIVPNEIRDIRGRMPYAHGGDDPLVPGPGGLVPLPLQTGYDLSGYADLMPLLGKQDNPAAKQEEEADGTLDAPKVDEPNGAPKKRWGGRLKTFNEADHPRADDGKFGPTSGLPSGGGSGSAGGDETSQRLGDASFINYNDEAQEKNPLNAAAHEAEDALGLDYFEDPNKTTKNAQECVTTAVARNREALKHIPEDKVKFVESWMDRHAKILQKPIDDLSAKAQAYREAEQAMIDHEGTEPSDHPPDSEPTRPEPDPDDFASDQEYEAASDAWNEEQQTAIDNAYDEQEKLKEKWEKEHEKLQDKVGSTESKVQDARERFIDKLNTFNVNFADKVMDILLPDTAEPKPRKSWVRRKDFRESDHPRAEDGKFGPKNGLPSSGASEGGSSSLPSDQDLKGAKVEPLKISGAVHGEGLSKVTVNGKSYFFKQSSASESAREAATADLAYMAGASVPAARVATINGKAGVLSEWSDGTPTDKDKAGFIAAVKADPAQASKLAAFNFLVGAEDRHGGNYLVSDGKISSIDHSDSLQPNRSPSDAAELMGQDDLLAAMEKAQGGGDIRFDAKAVKEVASKTSEMADHLRSIGMDAAAESLEARGAVLGQLASQANPTESKLRELAGSYKSPKKTHRKRHTLKSALPMTNGFHK